jgi:hypothetical protein
LDIQRLSLVGTKAVGENAYLILVVWRKRAPANPHVIVHEDAGTAATYSPQASVLLESAHQVPVLRRPAKSH